MTLITEESSTQSNFTDDYYYSALERLQQCFHQSHRVTESPRISITQDFHNWLQNNEYTINPDNLRFPDGTIIKGRLVKVDNFDESVSFYNVWHIDSSYSNAINYDNASWEIITMDKVGSELIFKKENGDIGILNFKDNQSYVIKNGTRRKNKDLKMFFRNYRIPQLVGVKRYNVLLDVIYYLYNNITNIGTLIDKLIDRPEIEKLILLDGFKIDLKTTSNGYGRYYNEETESKLYRMCERFNKNKTIGSLTFQNWINILIKTNQPLNDTILQRMVASEEELSSWEQENTLQQEMEYYDYAFRKFWHKDPNFSIQHYYDIVSTSYFKDLVKNYKYNPENLVDKINFYYNFEGLDLDNALEQLRDYAMMSTSILPPNRKYNKYPNYLLSRHAIVSKNYKNFKKVYDEVLFTKAVNLNKRLEYVGKKYSIILPEQTQDIKNEAAQLKHCVNSYIDLIIEKKSIIAFVRRNQELNKPFITLDIIDGAITQARGFNNLMKYDKKVKLFIQEFAKHNNLTLKVSWARSLDDV